ncbi:hypothetical protein [Flavobacterium sp. AED]|uniref:hypothetical protein n=1 Tax=Flavobacterium sp. AED TaxID=1423323 RepID=UPI00057CAF44|nr:hypothetical protein [Flavobacterium sp. AED]KIA82421.1 hypothetical protein OA85_16265 [Flavobacterium sp. AED]
MSNKVRFLKKIIELLSEKNSIKKEIIAQEIISIFLEAKNKDNYTEELKKDSLKNLRYYINEFLLEDNAHTRECIAQSGISESTCIED